MGAYTRFYGQVLVKPEFRAMIADLCDWQKTNDGWHDLARMYPDCIWIAEFTHDWRCNFIPCGSHGDGDWQGPRIDDQGIFYIDCELKNYEDTIGAFMRLIVPNIAIKAELFSHFEEDADPIELNYYSPEIAMSPELGNKEEVDLGLAPCLGGSKAV